MSSSQFPNFNLLLKDFATCVCLSDIWYKFIFLCICALAWNVLLYCQNARFRSCWLAGRLATSSAAQLPSTDCLPIIAPWPLLPSYDFPLKCFGMYKSAENQNGQLHFIRVPTIALSTDCSIQLPGVSSLSLFVFLFLDFPLFPSYPSLNCLSHVRCTAHRKLPANTNPSTSPPSNLCPDGEVPPQIVATSMYFCTEDDWEVSSDAVLLNWKQILPLRDSIHTGPQYFAAGSSSSKLEMLGWSNFLQTLSFSDVLATQVAFEVLWQCL